MDWNAVRDFLAVARLGSLSQAAEVLDVNASTVARRIEALENALGTRLFQRAQTGYVLTDEGERLQPTVSDSCVPARNRRSRA